jgi:cell division protein FtsQ
MELTRKISYRKVLQAVITLVVTTGTIVAVVGASRVEDRKMLRKVSVHIRNSKKYHFIEEKEVVDEAITRRNLDIMNTPVGKLDIQGIEDALRADPWIEEAQVFMDNNENLNINITQRVPVARLFLQSGESCYMDRTLHTMPLTPHFVFYTAAVTNVPALTNDSASQSLKTQLYKVVRTLQADTFWNSQTTQIVIDSPGCFELMPVLGNQRILLGDTSRLREKLDNLFAFYKNVLNRIGWDKYEVLDLRFRNQVIGKPSLPYHGPVDHAVAGMNWISSIVETEAKNEDIDTTHNADDAQVAQAATTPAQDHSPPPENKAAAASKKPAGKDVKHEKKDDKPDKKEKKKPDKKDPPRAASKNKKPPG